VTWGPGQSVGHNVGRPRYVPDVRGKLGHVGQLSALACCPRARDMCQGIGQRLVVSGDGEVAALQHVPEVEYAGVAGKKLPVKGRALLLYCLQLLGEEPKVLPSLLAM
jgi:hypothetical protein